MPRQGQTVAGSRQDRVRSWLRQHPGMHRCMEIAQGIGEPTHPVALACYELYKQGHAVRGLRRPKNGGRGFPTYGPSQTLLEQDPTKPAEVTT